MSQPPRPRTEMTKSASICSGVPKEGKAAMYLVGTTLEIINREDGPRLASVGRRLMSIEIAQ